MREKMTTTHTTHLILASASPRRRELLQQIQVQFHVHVVEIDETPKADESPKVYVLRMAEAKALAAYKNLREEHKKFGRLVILSADTSVVCDSQILGKPKDKDSAREQLLTLSGRKHRVLTSIAIVSADEDESDPSVQSVVSESVVEFKELNSEDIEKYLQTDEPYDKAGSYAVQGIAAQFIKNIQGSYSGIMGLPLFETADLLRKANIQTL